MGFKLNVINRLERIEEKLNQMAVDESKITTSVNNLVSAVNLAISDLGNLTTEITSLKASNNDAATQAALDALQAKIDTSVSGLTAAVAANQP